MLTGSINVARLFAGIDGEYEISAGFHEGGVNAALTRHFLLPLGLPTCQLVGPRSALRWHGRSGLVCFEKLTRRSSDYRPSDILPPKTKCGRGCQHPGGGKICEEFSDFTGRERRRK